MYFENIRKINVYLKKIFKNERNTFKKKGIPLKKSQKDRKCILKKKQTKDNKEYGLKKQQNKEQHDPWIKLKHFLNRCNFITSREKYIYSQKKRFLEVNKTSNINILKSETVHL